MARTTSYLTEAEIDRGGRTAFGAIVAGTLVALAVFALMTLLGIGIQFASIDPYSPPTRSGPRRPSRRSTSSCRSSSPWARAATSRAGSRGCCTPWARRSTA